MKLKFLSLLLFIGIISACSLDDNENQTCHYQYQMATTAVTGPSTTVINTPITLNVSFYIGNSCGQFDQFVSTVTSPRSIVALVNYDGCSCDTESYIVTKPYTFNATTAGTYVLNFLTEDDDAPITRTITVTAE